VDIAPQLDEVGYARLPGLLEPGECDELISFFNQDERFRSTIEMGRHAYGEGRYRYFAEPLPRQIATLREELYLRLRPIAETWNQRLGIEATHPASLGELREQCHAAGQTRPTPLILRYGQGGYNRMHQDVYGAVSFPLQVTCLLSSPSDFEGGEFLVSESRPRMQTRTEAIRLDRGEAIVIANSLRPVASKRGWSRANMRHGVSRIQTGHRYALGIIFHDAE
jgi:hypothetical protein